MCTNRPYPVAPRVAGAPTETPDLAEVDHARMLAKRARELDYRVEYQQGQPFYCHTAAKLGTRFEHKDCLSEPDFEDVVRRSEQLKNIMLQPLSCSGRECVHN